MYKIGRTFIKKIYKYNVESDVLINYVDAINSLNISMKDLKNILNINEKCSDEYVLNILLLVDELNDLLDKNPSDQFNVYNDIILQILNTNNGMLSTRMIEPLGINRQYLSIMVNKNLLEKSSRGLYVSPSSFEDSYFTFQQKYRKIIFSQFNALYLYNMTEEFPYKYSVTVPKSYHDSFVNKICNVFYVDDDVYEVGVIEITTPSGNKVRAYDKERCICDIIRSKGRMDLEQVKKIY